MRVEEIIPPAIQAPVDAALDWINETQQREYELSGVVDVEQALAAPPGTAFELGLVLCDGEICAREQVRVQPDGEHYRFALVQAGPRAIPPLLDPPENVRGDWLSGVLGKHEFVLLLFYRGLW